MKKLILAGIVALVVLVCGVAGAKFFLDQKAARDYEDNISSIAQGADDIVTSMKTALNSKAPMTWVYDRDMNLIMSLKLSNAVQAVQTVPDAVKSSVLSQSSDTARLIATEYLATLGFSDALTIDGYTRRVSQEFTADDQLRYLTSTSLYAGKYTGLIEFAQSVFGVNPDRLSDIQLAYAAYCYRKDDASIADFMISNAEITEDQLNAVDQSEYEALREIILEELQSIDGVDLRTTSYNVQVTLSTQQQMKLQNLIDMQTRQFIELNNDGTYAVDCSTLVIDDNGRIRAYVPRRSTNVKSSSVFKLNGLNFLDNLTQLLEKLSAPGACWLTLQEVKTSNGDTIYCSLEELFSGLALADSTKSASISAMDVVQTMYSSNVAYPGFGIIHEVQTLDGEIVYTWPSNRSQDFDVFSDATASHKVYEFFSEDDSKHSAWGYTIPLDTGFVSFHHTSNYTVVVVAGTGALGGSINGITRDTLSNVVSTIYQEARKDYPSEGVTLWPSSFEDLISSAYSYNVNLVEPLYTKAHDTLAQIEVTSIETRRLWESAYKDVTSLIQQYQKYLSPATISQWSDDINAIRIAVSDALLRYSA